MAEVRSRKQGGPSVDDGLIPNGVSEQLRQQILSEKDPERKNTLIQLAWDEAGNMQEPEFVSQSRKRTPKPKVTGSAATSNGAHASPRGGTSEGRKPANGARPAQDRKAVPKKTGQAGANPANVAGETKPRQNNPAAEASKKTAVPSKPSSEQTAIPSEAPAEAAKSKSNAPTAPSTAAPSQSAWASGKPLSKRLSEKPDEERRLADEKAKAVELAKQQEAIRRANAAQEEKKKREIEQAQKSATETASSAPPAASAVPATEAKAPTLSYAAMAKNAVEKKQSRPVAPQVSSSAAGANVSNAVGPVESAPVSIPPTVSEPAVVHEPVSAAPVPVSTLPLAQSNVRVPEGFGASASGLNFSFGDFSVDNSNAGTKFSPAPVTSSWPEEKKNSEASNSSFINNLMAGSSSAAVSNLVASASSVKEVESQLMSAAVGNSTNQNVQEPASDAPAMSVAATLAPSTVPTVSVPQTMQPVASTMVPPQASNPLMMGNPTAFAPRMPSNNMQMNAQIPKKGGRGQSTGMTGGRGGLPGVGMRMSYPMEPYYYEHSQGGYAMPYGQAPNYAADPQMFSAAPQFGYGSDMGYYAQQQQQPSGSAQSNAPPGLGGAVSSQTSTGEFATAAGQNAADMGAAASTSNTHASSGSQQQAGYLAQNYSSYGQAGVSQQPGFLQQQGTQQQQHAGAGSVGGTSQQQETGAYGGSHPSSFAGATYPQPSMYPYPYGSQMYYPQYSAYAPTTRGYSGFPQPVQYGGAQLAQDQSRQTAAAPQYYGQSLGSGAATSGNEAPARAGPPGYGAPSYANQQQQQQPTSESNWNTQQQEGYNYRPTTSYYQQSNAAAGGSTAQEGWRRNQ